MPPLQALVALHGLWTLVLVPPLVWVSASWSPARLRLLGSAFTLLGVFGLAIVVGQQLLNWLPYVSAEEQRYIPQRIVWAWANATDVPAGQVLLAGVICWLTGKRRRAAWPPPARSDRPVPEPTNGCIVAGNSFRSP
ncbi:MAG: hypothetical protein L0Z62_35895 [Gemmataceae bacterium]|nr:hypothetical protein [Gemmataceae bacterium]